MALRRCREILEKGYSDAVYYWRWGNGGTKWDLELIGWEYEEGEVFNIIFDTAWSPPIEAVMAAAERYPDLRFELLYHEKGMEFAGKLVIVNEKVVEEIEVDSGENPKKYKEFLTKEVIYKLYGIYCVLDES